MGDPDPRKRRRGKRRRGRKEEKEEEEEEDREQRTENTDETVSQEELALRVSWVNMAERPNVRSTNAAARLVACLEGQW